MLDDVRAAFHSVRRHPGFTLLAVLTVGLGIGATTAVFSVTEAVMLRPLPYPEADRLVDISHRTTGTPRLTVARLDVVDLRRETGIFQDVAGRGMGVADLTLRTEGEGVYHASLLQVTQNYFGVLGVEAALGRLFVPDDARPVSPPGDEDAPPPTPAVVISHGLWQRALGGDPNLEGRFLELPGIRLRVVGVLPPDFELLHERTIRWVKGTGAEIFAPFTEDWLNRPAPRGGPGSRGLLALGRLHPDVSYEQAQAAMDVMAARLRAEHPAHENEDLRVLIYPLRRDLTASSRRNLFVLAGGVAFLMLLVCANVTNLQLVRGRVQAGENAIRAALGCGSARLFGQNLSESLLLALTGGAVGIGLAWGAIRVVEVMAPRNVPLLNRIDMNPYAVAFGLGAAVIAMILSGLLPAYRTSRLDPAAALQRDSRGASARGRQRLMDSLVISEMALSMVLLTGAAVMLRTLVGMSRMELGFEPDGLVTFDLDAFAEEYRDPEARAVLYRRLEEELAAIPGVERVARTSMVPLGDAVGNTTWGWSQEVFDRQTERGDVVVSTPGYLRAMGTRLLAGRMFNESDGPDSAFSVLVDTKLAGMAWPGEDPVGKRIMFWRSAQEGVVVGVVEHMLMRDFGNESYEAIHVPEAALAPGAAGTFVLRTSASAREITASVRRAVQTVDPSLEPYRIRNLSERVSLSLAPTRFVLLLMGTAAAVALLVGSAGLFGVSAFTVRARTAELGVRMALGAEKGRIMSMVLGRAALLTLLGIAGGTVAAFILARFMRSLAHGLSPTDPLTLGVTALTLAAVSLLACSVPARWACRVDPARTLKGESL